MAAGILTLLLIGRVLKIVIIENGSMHSLFMQSIVCLKLSSSSLPYKVLQKQHSKRVEKSGGIRYSPMMKVQNILK